MKTITAFVLLTFSLTGLIAFAQEAETAKPAKSNEHAHHDHHDHQHHDHNHSHSAWLDVGNCEICKSMSSQEGLMESMQWETHMIPTGMLHFTIIPDEMRPKMEAAEKGMQQTISQIMQGQQKKTCGYCSSMGQLVTAGAKQTRLQTSGGDIMLVTSEDPAVIEKIQAHAKKTKDEYDKLMSGHK